MPTKLKIKDILLEKDFGSFVTGDGAIDYKNVIPDQLFGKAKDMDKLKTTPVTGDKAAHLAARADVTIDRIKDNLRSMGVNASDLSDQDTIDFYKALKIFNFKFSINKVIPGFFNGKKDSIEGKASVDQRSNAKKFVIYFTHVEESEGGKKENVVYRLNFSSKTLQKNLRGTDFDLPMLLNGEIYDVRISLKDGEPVSDDKGGEEDTKGGEEDTKGPAVPPEIKKNRNEIFRLLLKNYGNYDGVVVYGDGFKDYDEYKEYNKLVRAVKKGEVDKSKLKEFRSNSSRDKYSMMIANLRKSFPSNFLKKLDKAFPEFNLSYKKSMEESYLTEEENEDRYKRWSLVFGNVVDNKTIDNLDENIREFMLAVKKWFASPVKYRGKTQSYSISFDEDKVNQYWKKFYGTKKESISISGILDDLLIERKFGKKGKPPKGTDIGKGERWDDKEKLPKYFDRKLKIIDVPNYIDKRNDEKDGKKGEKPKVPKGESLASTSSKIYDIKGTGAGSWTSDSIKAVLNNEFSSGRVIVKKSLSKKDTLILYYPGIQQKLGTDAVLISKDNISNLFLGKKLKDTIVKIGPKAGGKEEFKEEGEAKITLLPS